MTDATRAVLHALLSDPARPMYGLQICRQVGLKAGTVQPILARLEGAGWLECKPEEIDPSSVGRPRRMYYHFSSSGAELAKNAIVRADQAAAAKYRRLGVRLPLPQSDWAVGGVE